MADIVRRYNMGLNSRQDPAQIRDGELQVATGIMYKPGDPIGAHKFGGRSLLVNGGVTISAMDIARWESTNPVLVTAEGTALQLRATDVGNALSPPGGVGVSPVAISVAHSADRNYVACGAGAKGQVIEPDYTVRPWGMEAPDKALTGSALAVGTLSSAPTAVESDGFDNSSNAFDGNLTTFASKTLSTAGTGTVTYKTWASDTATTGRYLAVTWSLAASGTSGQQDGSGGWSWGGLFGGGLLPGFKVTVTLQKAEDGSTFTNMLNSTVFSPQGIQKTTSKITDGVNLNLLKFKPTLTYVNGSKSATLRIHEVVVYNAPTTSTFDVVNVGYAVAEHSETYLISSVPGTTFRVSFTAKVGYSLTMPSAARNTTTTHWQIFRTPDEGTDSQLYKIATIPVAQTAYLDDFKQFTASADPSFQGQEIVPQIGVTFGGTTLYYPRDPPPPAMLKITFWRGHIVGIDANDRRILRYSVGGYPESFPPLYTLANLPLEIGGRCMALAEAGGSLIVGCTTGIIRIDDLATASTGSFEQAEPFQIKGAPGCYSPRGMTVVPFNGQSHAAWVTDQYELYITDGHLYRRLSDKVPFKDYALLPTSSVTLKWLKSLRVLMYAIQGNGSAPTGVYFLLHMDEEHIVDGQPKVTGPHYGMIDDLVEDESIWPDGSIFSTQFTTTHNTKIYREFNNSTGADAQQAYSGTQLPMILTGKKTYADWVSWAAIDGRLRHGSFGSGQTCTVAWTHGRDASSTELTRTQTVSLNGTKGTQFDIARSGEYAQETITHTSTGRSYITDLTVRVRPQGHEGKVA